MIDVSEDGCFWRGYGTVKNLILEGLSKDVGMPRDQQLLDVLDSCSIHSTFIPNPMH